MASVSEALECAICLRTYNLSERIPKALSCQHTICGQCVDHLKQGQGLSIKCPTCRQPSVVKKILVNFALINVLQALCEACMSKPQLKRCPHRNQNLCGQCLETHTRDVHKELLMDPDYSTLRFASLTKGDGSDPQQFIRPCSVVSTSDHIIVSDEKKHRVTFYDSSLSLQFVVGGRGSGHGQLCGPAGLAIGPGGEVFVADCNNNRIVVMTAQGQYMREFGTKGSGDDNLNHPYGIVISDGYVFITDEYNFRIKVVKTDGTFVRYIGSKGSSQGQFENFPIRVAVLSPGDGRILVKELNMVQLHVFSRMGEYQGLFPPSVPSQLSSAVPRDMTVDAADNVIVTYNTGQVAVYNSRGGLISVVGSRGSKPGEFDFPKGVSVNTQSGHLVVCDQNNHRLQMFKFDMK